MNRREFLNLNSMIGISVISGCIGANIPKSPRESPNIPENSFEAKPACSPNGKMASDIFLQSDTKYQHFSETPLKMFAEKEEYGLNEAIEIEIENKSDRVIDYSPGRPFTLLRNSEGRWEEILWSTNSWITQTVHSLSPGGKTSIRFEVEESQLRGTRFNLCSRVSEELLGFAFFILDGPAPTMPLVISSGDGQ